MNAIYGLGAFLIFVIGLWRMPIENSRDVALLLMLFAIFVLIHATRA